MPNFAVSDVDARIVRELLDRHVDMEATAATITAAGATEVQVLRDLRDQAVQDADRCLRAVARLRADFDKGGDDAPSAGFLERETDKYLDEHSRLKKEIEALQEETALMERHAEALLGQSDA